MFPFEFSLSFTVLPSKSLSSSDSCRIVNFSCSALLICDESSFSLRTATMYWASIPFAMLIIVRRSSPSTFSTTSCTIKWGDCIWLAIANCWYARSYAAISDYRVPVLEPDNAEKDTGNLWVSGEYTKIGFSSLIFWASGVKYLLKESILIW